MAPTRTFTRPPRQQLENGGLSSSEPAAEEVREDHLFLDLMMGTPLKMYVDKKVKDRKAITKMITENGGLSLPTNSGVSYILVDPYTESGQTMFKATRTKKGKVVLDARWVKLCVDTNELQTYFHDWAGCRVTGTEMLETMSPTPEPNPPAPVPEIHQPAVNVQPTDQEQLYDHSGYPYSLAAPQPSAWPPSQVIPPHLRPNWNPYQHSEHMDLPPPLQYDHRRYDWPHSHQQQYFDHPYQPQYNAHPQAQYMEHSPMPEQPVASTSTLPVQEEDEDGFEPEGKDEESPQPETPKRRKRARRLMPAPPASELVLGASEVRSPSPPNTVISSVFGGNIFTPEDKEYLTKYIEYSHEAGLVMSLRELCERLSERAPHHSFFSWRRYCQKNEITIGMYDLLHPDSPSGSESDDDSEDQEEEVQPLQVELDADGQPLLPTIPVRNRSPTPPRSLLRSTTGKGVAFTDEDVTFLVRFMDHRKSQVEESEGPLNMVEFWKEVVVKAPHHSRASWMKFWRRHKHELNPSATDAPLPQPPEKKFRYSREDDILLAKFFATKPQGTSDIVHQEFARKHPHHPWKGWQEHHRLHKGKVDYHIRQLEKVKGVGAAATATVTGVSGSPAGVSMSGDDS